MAAYSSLSPFYCHVTTRCGQWLACNIIVRLKTKQKITAHLRFLRSSHYFLGRGTAHKIEMLAFPPE